MARDLRGVFATPTNVGILMRRVGILTMDFIAWTLYSLTYEALALVTSCDNYPYLVPWNPNKGNYTKPISRVDCYNSHNLIAL